MSLSMLHCEGEKIINSKKNRNFTPPVNLLKYNKLANIYVGFSVIASKIYSKMSNY